MSTINLWGNLPEVPKVRTPEQILREQASELTKMTNGQIVGEVDPSGSYNLGSFNYRLRLRVPTLNNYSVSIAELGHEIGFYPVRVIPPLEGFNLTDCQNESEFVAALGKIFTSAPARRTISSLLAHIKSASE
jgi:hypothetical protein